ncbi:50S ribosomal protein L10 [Halocatena pleomorpha]|uniref:Large ribosomal subunit protein uL10 n=1 Tax=Halocatena pleomorpha TaxID=1785090 RepID=A0A3P3R9V1_9EURY|nr:50S ribosomal protein L10 [Halocatena pleomorpha]RRJ30236.1 50S ribosomal protein L10 [Halocatena pleomorpha]
MSAEPEHQTDVIPEWKREEVDALAALIERYESVGIVNIAGIPSKQLQQMRRDLHGSAELRVSRNTLISRALDESGDGFDELTELVSGQVGLIGTNDNPFGLYKELEASKTPAPINPGEVAPNDIVIPEGDTGIDPGPFVGELQQVGANARIDSGSIQVLEDSTVLDAGDEVSAQLANVLNELGIEPKEVGLDLQGVYSEGVFFEPDELAIDIEEYRADVQSAVAAGRNLSVNAVYPTARTADALVSKASNEARSLGLFAAIESPDIADDLVSKADAQMRALAAAIDDEEALPEELRGVDAPTATEPEAAESDEESQEETDADAEDESDADDTDDDDDGGAEGLGAMFG